MNEQKGVSWIKTAAKNGNLLALEYQSYWQIRFDKQPNVKKIQANLEKVVEQGNSAKACNTLAEFAHAQGKDEEHKQQAAKYYKMSAQMGCLVGKHWSGVFCMEGYGVSKDVNKAISYLNEAAKAGNSTSNY